jgi:hypothetical protein
MNVLEIKEALKMLSKEQNDEVSDTTDDESSNAAGSKK